MNQEEFKGIFKTVTGKEVDEFKDKPKEFADALNKNKSLRDAFRKAFPLPTEEDASMAAIGSLFAE